MRSIQVPMLIRRRQRRQAGREKAPVQRLSRSGLGCGAVALLLFAAGLALLARWYAGVIADLPSLAQLPVLLNPENGDLLQPTRLYDRSGEKLLLVLDNPEVRRRYLSVDPGLPEHLSPHLVQATITLEDPTFWKHPGFAWWRPYDPHPLTLAERLVSDLLLETEAPGWRRTLRMRLLAAQVVSSYGRVQVLEWYLNSASYGHLAYGAESAAQLYLGKSAGQLSLPEAALLAPLTQAPALNPLDSPTVALERQHEALLRLLSAGLITQQDYTAYRQTALPLRAVAAAPPEIAPAFNRLVLEQLAARYGRKRVELGGLRIITTLDYDLQLQLTCAAQTQLLRLQGHENAVAGLPGGRVCETAALLPARAPGEPVFPSTLAASGVFIDLESAQVLALLGDSAPETEGAALAAHQPGSLLSPFVAMAGFARGMGPASLVWDIPSSLPAGLAQRQNPDGQFHGPLRLRTALANDYLAPLSQLLTQIGPQNVWRLAEPLGLTLQEGAPHSDALLYEGGRVSPLEAAQAYAAFARLGEQRGERRGADARLKPLLLLAVQDQAGRSISQAGPPQRQAVLSAPLAYLVHHVLSDETARWPSLGYGNPLEIGQAVGAKTGQAAGGREVWTAGYTPQRLGVIWLGYRTGAGEPAPALKAEMAAGVWQAVIRYAIRDLPAGGGWSQPAGVSRLQVCDPSGKLPTGDCPVTVEEVFLSGNEPVDYDSLYRVVPVNRDTGKLATVFTPLEIIEERTYLVAPPEAQQWAFSAGLQQPPVEYDAIRAPHSLPTANITAPALFGSVSGKVTLRGTAAGEGLVSYWLEAGQGVNPRAWLRVDETAERAVEDGFLGVWDTNGLEDGLYALRLMVVRSDQQLDMAAIQVTVDNTAPVVRVLFPEPEQRFPSSGRAISLQAEVLEAVGLQQVEWMVDGRSVGETRQSPHVLLYQGEPGKHTLQVRARDLAGNLGLSDPLTFIIE